MAKMSVSLSNSITRQLNGVTDNDVTDNDVIDIWMNMHTLFACARCERGFSLLHAATTA